MSSVIQRSFAGGEISEYVYPLTGIKRRIHGLAKAKNTIIKKFGTVENRPGTEHFLDTDFTEEGRLVPFTDSSGEAYLLVFNNRRLTGYRNGRPVSFGGFTFTDTPFDQEMVKRLNFSQQADRLIITSYYTPPYELVKSGDSWGINLLTVLPINQLFSGVSLSAARNEEYAIIRVYFAFTAILNDRETRPHEFSFLPENDGFVFNSATPGVLSWDAIDGATAYRIYIRRGGSYFFLGETSTTSFSYIGEPPDLTITAPGTESLFPINALTFTQEEVTSFNGETGSFLGLPTAFRTTNAKFLNFDVFYVSASAVSRIDIGYVATLDSDTGVLVDFFSKTPLPFMGISLRSYAIRKAENFPNISFFSGQRLLLASTRRRPEDIYFSLLGQYDAFWKVSVLNDTSPYSLALATSRFSRVKFLAGLREPILFTGNSEWGLGSDLSPAGITPSPQTQYGIGDLPPVAAENSLVFLEGKNVLRDYGYDFQTGGYRGNDLSLFASHLFEGREIVSTAFQKDPDPVLWCVRDDGKVLSLTYFREQNIFAWCQHDFGGEVREVAVVQKTGVSEVYFSIKRGERYLIERLSSVDRQDENTWRFMDSHRFLDLRNRDSSKTIALRTTSSDSSAWTRDDDNLSIVLSEAGLLVSDVVRVQGTTLRIQGLNSADTEFSVHSDSDIPNDLRSEVSPGQSSPTPDWEGLSNLTPRMTHLAGQEVSVFADGSVVASPYEGSGITVPEGGVVELPGYYSVICVGLPYVSDVQTLPLDLRGQESLINYNVVVNKISLYLHSTRGLYVGGKAPATPTGLEGLDPKKTEMGRGLKIDPDTGVQQKVISGKWSKQGVVFIRQVAPLPFSLQSVSLSGDFASLRPDARVIG